MTLQASGIQGRQAGVILVGIVFGIMVLSGLTAAMLTQTSTTIISQARSTSTVQAYYAAESGYRYAASKIRHQADLKTDLHDVDSVGIGSNGARFSVDVYPYFYETTSAVASDTFTAVTPGGVETGGPFRMDTAASNYIKIISADKSTSAIHAYTGITGSGTDTVTFSGVSPVPSLPTSGAAVLPVVISTGSAQNGVGGVTPLNISASTDITDIFPKYNGAFKREGDDTVYLYKERDDDNNALTGITLALGSDPVSLNVSAATKISLEKFIKLKSTGIFGDTSREVIYNIPFPESFKDVEFQESFNDPTLSNWDTAGAAGSFATGTVDGDSALRVEGTVSGAGGPKTSLLAFDGASAGVDFGSAYRYGNETYINYDAQVKVGFEPTPVPDFGFDPSPIPTYFLAGLNFRLEDPDNTYGISFMRGSSSTAPTPDNLEDRLVPVDQQLLLTFWQQTGPTAADITWLAYKELQPTFYSDHLEAVWANWNYGSLFEQQITWNYTGTWATITTDGYGTSSNSLHDSPAGNYLNSQNTFAYTNFMDITSSETGKVSFRHHYDIDAAGDYGRVWLYTAESGWNTISPLYTGLQAGWSQVTLGISDYLPSSTVRLLFQLVTDAAITRDGWYVDDIRIYKEIPVQQSTLMARVQETMSFSFENGYDASGTGFTIQDGDWITDGTLTGYVDGDPILVGGDWADNLDKARGIIKLRNATGCFTAGAGNLAVIGKTGLAADVITCSARDNFIRVFYGDTAGYGTANSEPFDDEKLANPRGQVNFPAEEINDWTAASDYYTAVEWDAYNTADLTHLSWNAVVTADAYSVISSLANGQQRSNDVIRINTLSSPLAPPFTQPELGLHAYGKGAENVYFDDFGIQLSVGSERQYVPAVQE